MALKEARKRPGPIPKCGCNTWGCLVCMWRYVRANRKIALHKQQREEKKVFLDTKLKKKEKYDWDRT